MRRTHLHAIAGLILVVLALGGAAQAQSPPSSSITSTPEAQTPAAGSSGDQSTPPTDESTPPPDQSTPPTNPPTPPESPPTPPDDGDQPGSESDDELDYEGDEWEEEEESGDDGSPEGQATVASPRFTE